MFFVICSKGMDNNSQLLISEIIRKILPGSKMNRHIDTAHKV